jgi:hypothetical protein
MKKLKIYLKVKYFEVNKNIDSNLHIANVPNNPSKFTKKRSKYAKIGYCVSYTVEI